MAVTLTTSYQLIAYVKTSTYSQLRLYGKYNSQDITNNTSNISLQARLYGNGGSGSFSSGTVKINSSSSSLGQTSYSKGSETTLKTLTINVSHSNNGEYINKSVTAEISSTASVKGSLTGYISLPTIPRKANVTSSSDFTDEQNPIVYFNNPGGFIVHPYLNFYDNAGALVYSLERNISASSPYTWNISDTERTALRKATNKQMKYRVQVGVETFNGSSNLGANSVTQYMTYVNVDPEASATFEETNQKVIDLLGSANCDTLIQNVSKVKFSVVPTAKKESTIKSVQLIHDNIAIGKDNSPYEYIFDVKNSIFQVRVTDSRTNAKDFTYTKNIIEYSPVDITSFSFKREVQTSDKIILNATLRYTQTNFGSIANVPTISWKMGEDGELKTLSVSDYTIDEEKKEITIKNLSLGEILDYRKKEKFFLYVNDLLTEDKENEDVIKGLTTVDLGEHDLNVNGTINLHDEEGNNKIDIRDYLFEYEVIGTYEGE